ncbi:MAG: DNA primase catalytic subunit PriS [Candidatus Micrarchaeia archaeon]
MGIESKMAESIESRTMRSQQYQSYRPDLNEELVRKKFSEYYRPHNITGPSNIASREFGFGNWTKKIASRHFSFISDKELQSYLIRNSPFFVSYSVAVYKYPAARPIENKIMQGAELAFDIDSNELGLRCLRKHGREFACEECMQATKDAALRLIEEFVIPDFSVNPSNISVNWSGNRGYHIHIDNEFNNLGGYARRAIADYVNGKGIEYENIFREKGYRIVGPKPSDGGWKRRIARTVVSKLKEGNLESLGVSPRIAKKFYDANASRFIEDGNWERVFISKKKKFYSELIDKIVQMYSCHVDEQVTMDMSRLIRLPDTLHGETGMSAKKLRLVDLKSFNPFKDPLVFGSQPLKVHVSKCPEIVIGDQTFGPYKDEIRELPEFAAIYLVCKKVASVEQFV